MDVTQLIETCVVTGGMSAVLYSINKTETETDMAVLGYLSCSFLLILLHQVAPLFHSNPVQKTEGIYRSSVSSGLWCSFMIPAICVLAYYDTKTVDKLDTDLLCILLTLTLTLVHYNPSNVSQIAGALLLLWLKESFKNQDVYSLGLCTVYSILYYTMLCSLSQLFPKSFSYGECTVVLQSTLLIVNKILFFLAQVKPDDEKASSFFEYNMIQISMLAVLGIILATVLLYGLNRWTNKWKFYIVYTVAAVVCILTGLPKRSLYYSFIICVNYIRDDHIRLYLLALYTSLTIITVMYMTCLKTSTSMSIATRKLFHVIILAVYLPGLYWDTTFLLIASLLAFCVLYVVETIRYMDVPPFGHLIAEKYKLFIDKQDQGPLALTPIYLIFGISLPLWISFTFNMSVSQVSVYAGVLSVGIGDAIASLVGRGIGRLKWPGSDKTIEGSVASLGSQIITLYCLYRLGNVASSWTVYTVAAVTVTTILEAVTSQIDNLVLPLFLYILLIVKY